MELPADLGLTAQEEKLLQTHWRLVTEAGRRFNLTALGEDEAAEKHYRDCLAARSVLRELPAGSRLLDLGTGAGFPGLVLAAVCRELSFTLADATAKKCDFLSSALNELGLDNVCVVCGRGEDLGRGRLRESFDLVTARAVASLRELVELALPLLRPGGRLLAMKGAGWAEEVREAEHALRELTGRVTEAREYALSGGDRRCLLLVEKLAPTAAKYPRRPGIPHKRPL